MVSFGLIAFLKHPWSDLYLLFRGWCFHWLATRMRSLTWLLSLLHLISGFPSITIGCKLRFRWRFCFKTMMSLSLVRFLFFKERSWSLQFFYWINLTLLLYSRYFGNIVNLTLSKTVLIVCMQVDSFNETGLGVRNLNLKLIRIVLMT